MSNVKVSVRCTECGNPSDGPDKSALAVAVREVLAMDLTDPEQRAMAYDLLLAAIDDD